MTRRSRSPAAITAVAAGLAFLAGCFLSAMVDLIRDGRTGWAVSAGICFTICALFSYGCVLVAREAA